MTRQNPEISRHLLEEIKHQTPEIIDIEGVRIKTSAGVFPPKTGFPTARRNCTPYSETSGARMSWTSGQELAFRQSRLP
jgi:hypothetical protein